MRTTRLEKFKKSRHKRIKKFILIAVIVPSMSLLIGYLITSILILPAMVK